MKVFAAVLLLVVACSAAPQPAQSPPSAPRHAPDVQQNAERRELKGAIDRAKAGLHELNEQDGR